MNFIYHVLYLDDDLFDVNNHTLRYAQWNMTRRRHIAHKENILHVLKQNL